MKPLKRGGGRRYYRPDDIALLRRISDLLYIQGYTIKGVQRLLREGDGTLSGDLPPPDVADRGDELEIPPEPADPAPGEPAPPPVPEFEPPASWIAAHDEALEDEVRRLRGALRSVLDELRELARPDRAVGWAAPCTDPVAVRRAGRLDGGRLIMASWTIALVGFAVLLAMSAWANAALPPAARLPMQGAGRQADLVRPAPAGARLHADRRGGSGSPSARHPDRSRPCPAYRPCAQGDTPAAPPCAGAAGLRRSGAAATSRLPPRRAGSSAAW